MAKEILATTTSAAQSDSFSCNGDAPVTIIMYAADGLETDSEYGDIQISHDGGDTFQDLFIDGTQERLHGGNVAKTVYGAGIYRVDKEGTTNAALIAISGKANL